MELINEIGFEALDEGLCVQVLHTGPYSTESATIKKMDEFIQSNSYSKNGLHHEIYLSDPRKTQPEKIKTILRQPVR